jgi:hypothetical protein
MNNTCRSTPPNPTTELWNCHMVYIPGNDARKLVGVSYVVTRFATVLESLWVYYRIIDKSASARIPL